MRLDGSLPWPEFRLAYRSLRTALFSAPRPETTYLVADAPPGRVVSALGRRSFAPNWEFSYYKRGEDLNLARVHYHESSEHDVDWWQTHARGWAHDGSVWLAAHFEPEPTENARAHLEERGFDEMRGRINLARALDSAGIGYERLEWSRADNVSATHAEDPR